MFGNKFNHFIATPLWIIYLYSQQKVFKVWFKPTEHKLAKTTSLQFKHLNKSFSNQSSVLGAGKNVGRLAVFKDWFEK